MHSKNLISNYLPVRHLNTFLNLEKLIDIFLCYHSMCFEFVPLTLFISKMVVVWDVAPCSLVEVHQRFRGPCCLHHQGNESPCSLIEVYQHFRGPCCLHHQPTHFPDDGGSKDL
jgi:hypothetical protein